MTLVRAVRAELGKLLALPGSLVGMVVAVGGVLGISVLNAIGVRDDLQSGRLDALGYTSPVEAVFSAVPLGTVGAVVLGVIAVSSEYTANSPDAGGSRQIATTLVAVPGRLRVLAAKAVAVALLTAAMAAVTVPLCLMIAHGILDGVAPNGEDLRDVVARGVGAGIYWVLMALIAVAFTTLTRSGIVPLVVLIVNSSLVSVSFLLTRLTSVAYYLPDVAGMPMFARDSWDAVDEALDPVLGGLVMAAWTAALLCVAAVVFRRRDA